MTRPTTEVIDFNALGSAVISRFFASECLFISANVIIHFVPHSLEGCRPDGRDATLPFDARLINRASDL